MGLVKWHTIDSDTMRLMWAWDTMGLAYNETGIQ